jgi:hypothetical protein
MRRLFLIAVVYTALFGIGYAGGLLGDRPGMTSVAYAAPCVTTTVPITINSTCGSSGWGVFAQVTHCPASVPNAVNADLYDGSGTYIQTINLTYQGSGVWNGSSACTNPQTARTVTFVSFNGSIDQATAFANDIGCGSC